LELSGFVSFCLVRQRSLRRVQTRQNETKREWSERWFDGKCQLNRLCRGKECEAKVSSWNSYDRAKQTINTDPKTVVVG
jgi:hypothetical protein